MRFFLLVALAFLNRVSCNDSECESAAKLECEKKLKQKVRYVPEKKEDLRDACLMFEAIPQCVAELEKNCTADLLEAYNSDMTQDEWLEMYELQNFHIQLRPLCERHAYINSVEFRERVCESRANMKCRVHTVLPNKLPSTEKELEKACQNLYDVRQCLSDSIKECLESAENFDEEDEKRLLSSVTIEDSNRLIGVLTDICQKDSDLHKEFVPKLSCYSRMMDQVREGKEDSCDKFMHISFEYLNVRMERKAASAGRPTLYSEYRRCLWQINAFNCYALKSEEFCGDRARDILLEIFQRVANLSDVCPKHILVDVLELINDQEMITKHKVYTKNLLPNAALF